MAAGIHANYQGNENYISNSKLIETVKNIKLSLLIVDASGGKGEPYELV